MGGAHGVDAGAAAAAAANNIDRYGGGDEEESEGEAEKARQLWRKLREAGYEDGMERFVHFWRIVKLAELATLSPVGKEAKASTVWVCVSLAVSDDGQEMRAASRKVRTWMRINQYDRHPSQFRHLFSTRQDVWKYEHTFQTPSLIQTLHDNGELLLPPPNPRRSSGSLHGTESSAAALAAYAACAEPAVYEKLNRIGAAPKFLYTLQKSATPGGSTFSAQIVPRCENCKVARADKYWGDVVTDKPPLRNLPVPKLTLPAMRAIREFTHPLTESHGHDPAIHKATTVWLDGPPSRILLARAGAFRGPEWTNEVANAINRQKRSVEG